MPQADIYPLVYKALSTWRNTLIPSIISETSIWIWDRVRWLASHLAIIVNEVVFSNTSSGGIVITIHVRTLQTSIKNLSWIDRRANTKKKKKIQRTAFFEPTTSNSVFFLTKIFFVLRLKSFMFLGSKYCLFLTFETLQIFKKKKSKSSIFHVNKNRIFGIFGVSQFSLAQSLN